MAKKKRSLFLPILSLLTVIALLLGTFDVFLYQKLKTHLNYKTKQDTELVDMTDENGSSEFGRIYCAPIDEEHVVIDNEISGTGYIDNEVLVVANEGVTREQITELAASYNAEIVGEIEVTGDYQFRLKAAPEELETVVVSISADPIVASATRNYVDTVDEELFESGEQFGDFFYFRE